MLTNTITEPELKLDFNDGDIFFIKNTAINEYLTVLAPTPFQVEKRSKWLKSILTIDNYSELYTLAKVHWQGCINHDPFLSIKYRILFEYFCRTFVRLTISLLKNHPGYPSGEIDTVWFEANCPISCHVIVDNEIQFTAGDILANAVILETTENECFYLVEKLPPDTPLDVIPNDPILINPEMFYLTMEILGLFSMGAF